MATATVPLSPIAGYQEQIAADLSDPRTRERLSPAAIEGFLEIMTAWKIKDTEARKLLGGVSTGTYHSIKKAPEGRALDQDTLTRISLLIGIFKALNILYSTLLADSWITLPNSNAMFGGGAPLDYMIQRGLPGMIHVRQLLDARRGGQ